ncbi:MAG: D-glycerate dehydrogenase [Candidatus Doudnabacteria bacterium RIFCSPLOWO2_02_FULL_48_8]|uniref:D-glycerate dehydrogenase n=1 Tax=Candidatus Doudnabacteria bacterium RIFCSPHIGHO2_01_FULL_46_24 TaxID=1817825 RepID=A0A1F5NUU9_9BACT|nr:MAG: D-glycerate dehydrogenase [Candidatus Doudnabacteria bacterium RIFCSPHIGHO2_01_FULL_46_24]OGE95020.1 MAG: D-glycerate dehydrogenase [Candidatus Doudnabacteria bacterium RIFCSPLOWO2_02_FULL_48_8]OGE95940.1 MAG: D-glycerate dehydrogenase [Candidatus Doudnabacteria bacterium RIFCSPHIGHO2_12_FULL_48_11]
MKIFVTRKIPQVGIDMLKQAGHEVKISPLDRPLSREELMLEAAGCDALLSQLVDKIDGVVLDTIGPQLKIVANYAVGYDNINIKDAAARHVLVTNTPDILTGSVADHAFGLMLAAGRRIVESDRFSRAGKYTGWQPFLLLGQDVFGKTLGIVGTGRIGAALAERAAKGFGMKILYHDQKPNDQIEKDLGAKFCTLEELLKNSDFVSVHVPLLDSTRHMFGAAQFELMKKTAIFVNTSRGPVVNEAALRDALKKGDIFAAGIDVWEHEPELTPGLAELENIVITPHTASATIEARDNMSRVAAENIIAALKGNTPPNIVKANS